MGAHRGQRVRLEAREAKVQPSLLDHRPRELKPIGVALLREPRHVRPTRVGKPQHFSGLVEGLARSIIKRLTQQSILAKAIYPYQLSMTT